mmetsp:Transcript_46851/g.114264  ORF Transcript_46851/g.114264 Transcript_46851/m.114264 type:complete len:1056 (-) Transcript_46851:51-3218(-)
MALVLSSSHQNDLTMKLVGREEEDENSPLGRSTPSVQECTDESSNNNASQIPQHSTTPASQAMDVEEFNGNDSSSSSSPPPLPFAVEEEDDNDHDDDVDVGVGDVTSATNSMAVMDDDEAPAVPESNEAEEQDESGEEDSSYVMVENENVNDHEHEDGGEDDTMQQQQQEEDEKQTTSLSSDDYWDTAASNTAEETTPAPTPDPPLILLPPPPQLRSTNTVIEEEEPDEEDKDINSNDDNNDVNGADKSMSVDPLFDGGFDFPFASSSSSSPSNPVDDQDQHQEEQVTEFGGLDNMGNTCYMNSALQMLASLDGFTADLRSTSMPVIVKGEVSLEEQQQEQERNSEEINSNDDADCDTEMIVTSTMTPSPTTNSGQDSSPLRDSLLDVFKRLVNGETIRPGNFKECIDDRTPLFVGYDQQDAHEFLTTLLDILDEDYKRKQKPEQEDENETSENDNSDDDDAQKDNIVADGDRDEQTNDDALAKETGLVSDSEEDEKITVDNEILAGTDDDVDSDKNFVETGSSLFESTTTTATEIFDDENVVADHAEDDDDDDDDDVAMETSEPSTLLRSDDSTVTVRSEHETPSSTKKQRLHETEFEIVNGTGVAAGGTDQSFPRTSSLSNMEFVDIENLLYTDVSNTSLALVPHTAFYDDTTDNSPAVEETVDEKAPKCKLVGGRMDPTDAVLTRYESGADSVPAEPDSTVGANNAPSANSLSEATPRKKTNDADGNHDSETTSTESVRSPIDSNFCTEIKVCLICDSCKFRRSHTEKYLHLSLEMGDGISSIDDGLRKFFASEEREVKCEKCFYNKSTVTKEIVHLPRALLLHLKRFIVDISPDYTSISYRKDRSDVSFEERMSLARVVGDDEEDEQLNNGNNFGGLVDFLAPEATVEDGSSYAIRSVVNHMGSTATFGHYTADAKRVYPQEEEERNVIANNDIGNDDDAMLSEDRGIDSSPSPSSNRREWIRFNDSYVSKISSTEALQHNSSAAYLVLYEMEKKSDADRDDIRRSHHCEDETYHETTDSTDAADAVKEVDDSTMHYYADDNNTDVMAVCI